MIKIVHGVNCRGEVSSRVGILHGRSFPVRNLSWMKMVSVKIGQGAWNRPSYDFCMDFLDLIRISGITHTWSGTMDLLLLIATTSSVNDEVCDQ